MADSSTTAKWIPILYQEDCWTSCQLRSSIRYVTVVSKPIKLPSPVEGRPRQYPGGILLNGRFLHKCQSYFNAACGRLLGFTPVTQRYMVCPFAIKIHEVVVFSGGSTLVEFYSMADSSTTARRISIMSPGGFWARRQLYNGIRYVPTSSKLIKLFSFVKVVPQQNSTRQLIPLQPLQLFQFCLQEIVGLDPSAKIQVGSDAPLLRQDTRHWILAPMMLGAFYGWLLYSLAPGASG